MTGTVIDKSLVKELVEKLANKDDEIKLLQNDKKKLIDDYTQRTGVPDKKTLKIAISIAKKEGIDMEDVESLVSIITPIVA